MKRLACLACCALLAGGCAESQRGANSKIIRENEQRIASLEESVTALNTQIAQLNNRVYEVRTKAGQKTSMTVVPVNRPLPAPTPPPAASELPNLPVSETPGAESPPAAQPVASQPAQKQPVGRKIDPKARPAAMTGKAQAAQKPAAARGARPANAQAAGQAAPASGSIGATQPPLEELALPPADVPAVPPVPQGNVPPASLPTLQGNEVHGNVQQGEIGLPPVEEAPAIPVPVMPVSDLSLPPEQPQAAPVQAAKAPARARTTAPKSEQAAYNAALSAARSGRTAEGIRLFRDFLQKYPNGPYAANAEYWIGECLYSQGKYQDALSEFQSVNNSYPRHHKNADALLKAGLTMSKMGDKAGAAEKFRTLIANFPNSDAARRARAMGAN